MKHSQILWLIIGLTLISLVAFLANGLLTPTLSGRKVATTIFPLYDITRNIAGDEVSVVLIAPPGASPHTFDLTPQQARNLAGSQAIFAFGYGLDDWVKSLASVIGTNHIVVVDKNINLQDFAAVEEEHVGEEADNDDHEGDDPHYWLSVPNGILIAEQVKDELSSLYPDSATVFESNFVNYKSRLESLDSGIRQDLSQLPSRKIATFHSAWFYFAREYDIDVIATFEEFPGEEPTVRWLADFQKKAREQQIKVIFAEPQFSSQTLNSIASDLGIEISILDPIGGAPGVDSYEKMMRYNADQIISALK